MPTVPRRGAGPEAGVRESGSTGDPCCLWLRPRAGLKSPESRLTLEAVMAVGYGKLSPKVVKRALTKGAGVRAKAVEAMGKALKGMKAK